MCNGLNIPEYTGNKRKCFKLFSLEYLIKIKLGQSDRKWQVNNTLNLITKSLKFYMVEVGILN